MKEFNSREGLLAADLIYILNWDINPSTVPVQKQLFIGVLPQEELVYDYLNELGKQQQDLIVLKFKMPPVKLRGFYWKWN